MTNLSQEIHSPLLPHVLLYLGPNSVGLESGTLLVFVWVKKFQGTAMLYDLPVNVCASIIGSCLSYTDNVFSVASRISLRTGGMNLRSEQLRSWWHHLQLTSCWQSRQASMLLHTTQEGVLVDRWHCSHGLIESPNDAGSKKQLFFGYCWRYNNCMDTSWAVIQ